MNPSNSLPRTPREPPREQNTSVNPLVAQYQQRLQQQQGLQRQGLLAQQNLLLEHLAGRQQSLSLRDVALAHQHPYGLFPSSTVLQPQHLHPSNLLQADRASYPQQRAGVAELTLELARLEDAIRRGGLSREEIMRLEERYRSSSSSSSSSTTAVSSAAQVHQQALLAQAALLQRLGYGGGGSMPSTATAASRINLDSAPVDLLRSKRDASLQLLGKRSAADQLQREQEWKRQCTTTPTTTNIHHAMMKAVHSTTTKGFPLPRNNDDDVNKLRDDSEKKPPKSTNKKYYPRAKLASYQKLWTQLGQTSMRKEIFRRRVCKGTVPIAPCDSRSIVLLHRMQQQQEKAHG